MLGSHMTRRLAQWAFRGRSAGRGGKRSHRRESRLLRAEPLEQRDLLSVTGIGNETFKSIPFTASGKVVSDYNEAGYHWHLVGTANLTQGVIVYDSVSHGTIAKRGTTHGALLSVNNGTYSATGKSPSFNGSWKLNGYTDNIVDQGGKMDGTVIVQSSSMQIPTRPTVVNSFKGTYNLENAKLNTSNFALAMDLTRGDTKMTFNGTLTPTGSAFDVVVTPTWNSNGTIHVGVRVPGQPHKTATANRSTPVTRVQVYWAQGTTLKSGVLDSIPVYWNEASGAYTVAITDYPAAPAGATGLAFVTQFDGKTRIATLALPKVSIGSAVVAEGDSRSVDARNHAVIPVTLSKAFVKDVTVSYTTFVASSDTAKPNVNYAAASGSIVIPAGQTRGQIDVSILGNTTYELNKKFSVKLTQVRNAGLNTTRSQGTCTITNDDPIPTLSIADVAIAEGTPQGTKGKTTNFVFTATLSNPSYQKLTVNYRTADGTAKLTDKDYVAKTGTLTFAPGAKSASLTIVVNADAKVEVDETFFVNLSVPTGMKVNLATNRVKGTILNDDASPIIPGASRDAALKQMAGVAQLAGYFDPLDQNEESGAAADSVGLLPVV